MRTLRSASVAISLAMALAVPAASCTMPASEPSPRTVVEKRFAAVARHDVEAIAALYAQNAVETSPAFCTARKGPEGVRRTYGDLFRDFPGITADDPIYLVQGNRVAVQFLARVRKVDG